jgi:hypothetical protein
MRAPPILRYASPMPTVTLTRHLHAFFPTLAGEELRVDAATVAEVVQAIERSAISSMRGALSDGRRLITETAAIRSPAHRSRSG